MMPGQWVDDVVTRATGSQGDVKLTIGDSALDFAAALERDGLKVSIKSTVIASVAKIGKGLVRTLAGQGLRLKYASSVRDLGVDNAAGTGRRKQVIRARFMSGALRHQRVLSLRRHAGNKAGKKLFSTGTMPATTYGLLAYGPSPKRLQKLRAQNAQSAGWGGHGACTTMTLAIACPGKDPAVTLYQQQLAEWIIFWVENPRWRQRSVEAWRKVTDRLRALPPNKRWAQAKGALSATVIVLLDLGWDPQLPHRWVGDGLRWDISNDAMDFGPLFEAVRAAVEAKLWAKASTRPDGRGAEHGVDTSPILKHLKWLEKKGWSRTAGALATVACGAAWTNQRCYDAGYRDTPLCDRCKAAPETMAHRVWGCCENTAPIFEASANLEARARLELEANPVFWLRGVTPKAWTETELPGPEDDALYAVGRAVVEPALADTYFIDGSGTSADKRIRRTGLGAAKLCQGERGLEIWGGWYGPMIEPPFTVPRAELTALINIVQLTTGDITVVSDCRYVVDGFGRGRHRKPNGRNGHLWADLAAAIDKHDGSVRLRWVKAHISVQEFEAADFPAEWVLGNEAADALAKRGAALVQVPEARCSEIARADAIAWKVRIRIAAATIDAAKSTAITARRSHCKKLRATRRATVVNELQTTSHDIAVSGSRLACGTCKQSRPRTQVLQWLRCPCAGPPSFQTPAAPAAPILYEGDNVVQVGNKVAHGSHSLAAYRGVTWCWRCGSHTYGKVLHSLAKPCPSGPTEAGQGVLSRLRKGRTPKPGRDWPVGSDEWDAEFPPAPPPRPG